MTIPDASIRSWSAQFRDAGCERAYRDAQAQDNAALVIAAGWTAALLPGACLAVQKAFGATAIAGSASLALAALAITLLLRQKVSALRLELALGGFVVVDALCWQGLLMAYPSLAIPAVIHLFVLLALLYLVAPMRLPLAACLAVTATAVDCLPIGDLILLAVAGNGLGYAFGRRLHTIRRRRFVEALALEHELRRRRGIEERLREETRRAEDAARAKSEFLAMMSHEIRTPMNGVLGMLRLLRDTRLTAQQRDYTDTIHYSAEALLAILDDVLDFSKLEAGRLELESTDVDLPRLVSSINELMRSRADEKELALTLAVAGDAPRWVRTDSTRLRQILLNLVGNAVKFTDRGSVTVSVSVVARAETAIRMRFSVADTGIGIPETARARLFSEFSQADGSISRRFGGTGLGLAICKRLVTLLGGEIGVDSREGRGSTFWFELPLSPGRDREATPEVALQVPPLRLLLVEDHPVNQKVAVGLLARNGHSVDVANNGFEALGMVQAGGYDAVLMDMQMPVMDGLQATASIRALGGEFAGLPIIAMTANALKGDAERCRAAGMDGYVAKPIDPALLDAALVEHVMKRPAECSSAATAFDRGKLCELEDALGEEAARTLMSDFFSHAEHAVDGILAACRRDEPSAVHPLAHDLKSLSGTFGFVALRHLAEAIEMASRDGRHEEVSRLASGLPERLHQASREMMPQAA